MSLRDIPAHSPGADHAANLPHAVAPRGALGRLNPARAQSSAPPPRNLYFFVWPPAGSPRDPAIQSRRRAVPVEFDLQLHLVTGDRFAADRTGGSAPGPAGGPSGQAAVQDRVAGLRGEQWGDNCLTAVR